MIPVLEPYFTPKLKENVNNCIDTGWISSQGKYILEFENSFAEKFRFNSCVACSNGTTALHLALEALGVGENDEVLVPDLTFAATINAVFHAKAKPVIVDIEESSWNISTDDILKKITPQTKAIIVVHLYGYPFNVSALRKRLPRQDIYIVEDCAEAIGARYGDVFVGSEGDAAAFSFFANKVITTGEGGMVAFRDQKIADKAKVLRDHGMNKEKRYWHDYVGFNYRMTNIQAAIGLSQLEAYDHIASLREKVFSFYDKNLLPLGLRTQVLENNSQICHWLYSILLPANCEKTVPELQAYLRTEGIDSRPLFHPLSEMEVYKGYYKGDNRIAKMVSERGISLPSSATLSQENLDKIYIAIKRFLS